MQAKKIVPVAAAGAAAIATWKLGPRGVAQLIARVGTAATAHVTGTVADEIRRNRETWRDLAREGAPVEPPIVAQRAAARAPADRDPDTVGAESDARAHAAGGWSSWWAVLKETFAGYSADKLPRLSAALAYYTIFSLAPLLLLVLGVIGLVFDRATVQQQLLAQFGQLIGEQGAQAIATMLGAGSATGSSIIATVVGLAILAYTATNVFVELQSALNTIWKVAPKAGRGVWGAIRQRFAPFSMIVGCGFLLVVSLVASAGVTAAAAWLANLWPALKVVLRVTDVAVFLGISTLLFALIYKVLPDVKLRWHDVWAGALWSAILFSIGRVLIGLYLGHSNVASSFGAAGSLVVLLLWIYYSSQILLLGAEYTRARVRVFGPPVTPKDGAEKTPPDVCRDEPAVAGALQPPKIERAG